MSFSDDEGEPPELIPAPAMFAEGGEDYVDLNSEHLK